MNSSAKLSSCVEQDAAPPKRTCSAIQLDKWRQLKLSAQANVAREQGVSDAAIDAAMDSDAELVLL